MSMLIYELPVTSGTGHSARIISTTLDPGKSTANIERNPVNGASEQEQMKKGKETIQASFPRASLFTR